jgi:threonine aldolase
MLAEALGKKDFIGTILPVETNIVIFEVRGEFTPVTFVEKMNEYGIRVFAISKTQVRMVLHLDVFKEMVEKTIKVIESL